MSIKDKGLHANNIHQQGYDFKKLTSVVPALKEKLVQTPKGDLSIDFKDKESVFLLNKALLEGYYHVQDWKILPNSLCPPIPGRADYLHHVKELLDPSTPSQNINVLDIGTGSSVIYPLLGVALFDWNFVGTDTHEASLYNAQHILSKNKKFREKISLRKQDDTEHTIAGVMERDDFFDLMICNPPFYSSREEHWQKVVNKNEKLHKGASLPQQNFGGIPNELWCPGGEKKFIRSLIYESLQYQKHFSWCTTLVSNKEHIKPLRAILEYHKVKDIRVIPMSQGQKSSRVLAWKLK